MNAASAAAQHPDFMSIHEHSPPKNRSQSVVGGTDAAIGRHSIASSMLESRRMCIAMRHMAVSCVSVVSVRTSPLRGDSNKQQLTPFLGAERFLFT